MRCQTFQCPFRGFACIDPSRVCANHHFSGGYDSPFRQAWHKNGASSAKLTPDWCRITRRSGAVFPAVKKSAIGELISVVRKHTPQLPGTPGGTCTHDLAIWPHTLLLSYRSVSPTKMAARQMPAAISERVRRKKKGVILHPVGAAVSGPPRIPGGVPTADLRIPYPLWDDTIFSHFFGCLV